MSNAGPPGRAPSQGTIATAAAARANGGAAAAPPSPAGSSAAADDKARKLDSLDLVCKDEEEFQTWAVTLQAFARGQVGEDVLAEGRTGKAAPVGGADAAAGVANVYVFGWGLWGQTFTKSAALEKGHTPRLLETMLAKGVSQLACGWAHTAVLLDSGAVMQAGYAPGTGAEVDLFSARAVPFSHYKTSIVALSCGNFHTAAVSDRGEVFTWGSSFRGQLGLGSTANSAEPVVVESLAQSAYVVRVACGGESTAALTHDGKVYTWGSNRHGALGLGDTEDRSSPEEVRHLAGAVITHVAAGGNHMFACATHEAYSWGSNSCGQLGLGHSENQLKPHTIDAMRGKRVLGGDCGAAHTVALVEVNEDFQAVVVFAWGSNASGQLGLGPTKKDVHVPLCVEKGIKDRTLVDVVCGDLHTVLRTQDGHVFCTGDNSMGQLGMGNTADLTEFAMVPTFRHGDKDKQAHAVACGGRHTSVITLSKRAWVADSETNTCMSCKSAFTFVNRKHHCRNCGGIFCGRCSSKRVAILALGETEPVRVCDECYDTLR